MKKLFLLVSIFVAVGFLTGCQKKATLTVSPSAKTSTPIPKALEELNSGSSKTSSTAIATINQNENLVADGITADTTFGQNYSLALDDAQKALKSGVRYCGAKIKFYGASLTEESEQTFYFYSDSFSNDYYWAVTLNGYQSNQKTRNFAAKKDLAEELKCMSQTGAAPGTFSGAYANLTKSDPFKKIDIGTIAQTSLVTMDSGWKITVTDNTGRNLISTVVNTTANLTGTPQ